ncbi:HDIG domain-containing protein [bacterium]|nr:HDIG domain-containing protein [bacterium]
MNKIKEFITEKIQFFRHKNLHLFFAFVLTMSVIISSQNFFFQRVIENGISKKDVIAQKTITVVDTKRTDQHKKEVSQGIEPILTQTEDNFIKENLDTLEKSVNKIREKDASIQTKTEELKILFDIQNKQKKDNLVNYLLWADDRELQSVFNKTKWTLDNILLNGISESDVQKNNINAIIQKNISPNIPKNQSAIISTLLEQIIVPNLVVDEMATEIAKRNAQNAVRPYEVTFKKGEKIVFEGEPVTQLKRDALRKAGYNFFELNYIGFLGIFLLITLSSIIFLQYEKSFEKKYTESNHLKITAVLTLFTALVAVVLPTGFSPYILPMPAFIIIMAIFTNPRIAFFAATLLLGVLTIGLYYRIEFVTAFILLNTVAMITVSKINYSKRFDLILAGIQISGAGLLIVLCIYMLDKLLIDVDGMLILRDALLIFINGILSGIVALGTLPLLEKMFNITTPYSLAELADHNQPLLKRLQFEAPGTYHHSLMVANLSEAAAEAIGANPILARVGAFYHDIGKLKRPLFFVENQSYFGIENPHTKLNPRLSKMVITSHPKDGVDIAKEYKLPAVIQNFILQHHGDGLASYFYNQAIIEEGAENVKEEQFRYVGPKPNMKETAILMIADAVESAVRSLKSPTNEEIEAVIEKIVQERLRDGQFSDSPLTLKDIKIIKTTFNRILRGMQHNRIKYQEANLAQEFDKNKINVSFDKDLEEKIKKLENKQNDND